MRVQIEPVSEGWRLRPLIDCMSSWLLLLLGVGLKVHKTPLLAIKRLGTHLQRQVQCNGSHKFHAVALVTASADGVAKHG